MVCSLVVKKRVKYNSKLDNITKSSFQKQKQKMEKFSLCFSPHIKTHYQKSLRSQFRKSAKISVITLLFHLCLHDSSALIHHPLHNSTPIKKRRPDPVYVSSSLPPSIKYCNVTKVYLKNVSPGPKTKLFGTKNTNYQL